MEAWREQDVKIPSFKWKRARIGNIGSMSGTVREMCGLISIQPSRFWCIITASYFEICMTNNTAAVHVVCYMGGSLSRVSQATRDLQFVIKTVWKCDVEIDVYLGTFPPEKCGLVKSRLGNFLSFFFSHFRIRVYGHTGTLLSTGNQARRNFFPEFVLLTLIFMCSQWKLPIFHEH